MRKIILISLFILLIPVVPATTNLDFRLDVEEKGFYPNEKIPLSVTVVNRDTAFAAKDAELTVNIGDRFYTYDLGDLKPGETFEKEIMLPEFPAGTHSIRGEINYTGILDERFVEISYGSFEVLFPPIERYPRNVYVSAYDLPEKIIGGKSYDVSITITNDGEVDANLLIEFGSIDEFESKETTLALGESTTVKLTVKFDIGGVSLIEARAYAVINGEKYLLNYRGKKTFVQSERLAKLSFDRIELVGENDNEINQKDTAKFKVFIKNTGETATDVKGELLSSVERINIIDSNVLYTIIASKDSVAPSDDTFEIETGDIDIGDYNLNLKLTYIDSENREKSIEIPLTIGEGEDLIVCTKDADCSDTQTCDNNKCVEVECVDGYVKDHKCIKYECVKDSDCKKEFYTCDQKLHICKPPQCESDVQCEDNEVCGNGKCQEAFTLVIVPLGISDNTEEDYYQYSKEEMGFFRDTSPLREAENNKKSLRIHYIDPSLCSSSTQCSYRTSSSCYEEVRECVSSSGLAGIADKLVAIVDNSIGACGFAGIGGHININKLGCKATPAHELGHNFGLYHIEPEEKPPTSWCGKPAGACKGVNADDCKDPKAYSDTMSYCSPEDHFGPQAYSYMKLKFFNKYLGG